jgi:hypothetical protein
VKSGFSFLLVFYISKLLEVYNFLDCSEMKGMGFLPNGFFERLLCKIISICLEDSPSQVSAWRDNIRKDSVLLSYKGQRFQMTCRLSENMISVDVFGRNPIPIYLLLTENIETICEESFHTLKYMTLLPYPIEMKRTRDQSDTKSHSHSHSQSHSQAHFMKLSFLEQCVSEKTSCSLPDNMSLSQLKEDYNIWLFRLKHSLSLSGYDIFLSYRQNDQDSALVKCLLHEFSNYSISSEKYSPVSVFLDDRRLKDAEDFREGFVSSLLQSKIIVPVVTVEALKRMLHHNPAQVDNLLLEWILAIHVDHIGSGKVFPLVFGSYALETIDSTSAKKMTIREIQGIHDPHSCSVKFARSDGKEDVIEYKEVNVVNLLTLSEKKIVPERTLATADSLLRRNGQKGLDEEMKNQSLDQIISKLLTFKGIFLSSSDLSSSSRYSLKQFAAKHVERIMKTLSTNVKADSTLLVTENDHYFYNQKIILKDISPTNSSAASVKSPLLSPIPAVILSQTVLDTMLSSFSELQANHQLTLKFFLFQKCYLEEDDEKAELLSVSLGGFTVTAYDDVEGYLHHLQSFIPVGFEEEAKAFLYKLPHLFSYKKKVNELKQQLHEMINDFQKPFYGIEI